MKTAKRKELVEKYVPQYVEEEREFYVADDGNEFETERECIFYESNLEKERKIKAAEKLRLHNYDDVLPLSTDGCVNENNIFRWYKVKNEDDFNILNAAYKEALTRPEKYPEIICVETAGYEPYIDDPYDWHMSNMMEDTKEFWNDLGYEVTFKKEREI